VKKWWPPPHTVPRSIIISVVVVFLTNLLLCLSGLGVIPWREAMQSPLVVSAFMGRVYGNWAGVAVSVLIIWSAFAGTYALILVYFRVPYAAALDGNFFHPFSKLHTRGDFPHVFLLLIGGLSVLASLFELADVINALMTARILVQFVMQSLDVVALRRFRPEVCRPFKMILYPLPCAVALVGWLFLFFDSGIRYVSFGLLTVLAGCAAFAIMSLSRQTWPFGKWQGAGRDVVRAGRDDS
jgi:APA family basic amino acid/polyamine antiporter